jgi:hypothetical protein
VGLGLGAGALPEPDPLDPPGDPEVSAYAFGVGAQTWQASQ